MNNQLKTKAPANRHETVSSASSSKRLVVFVGGFDPRGARHYHQLMCKEAQKQSQVDRDKADFCIGPRSLWKHGETEGLRHSVWTVSDASKATDADGAMTSDYIFFEWSDVVRRNWPRHTWQVMAQAWSTYGAVTQVRSTLAPLHRETPYVLWTLAYPLLYMLMWLGIALGAFIAVMKTELWPMQGVGLAAGSLAAVVMVLIGYQLDKLLHVSWLLRILSFAKVFAHAPVPELQERVEKTADTIVQQCLQVTEERLRPAQAEMSGLTHGRDVAPSSNYQEVVVVGFSVGSVLAVALVHALRKRLHGVNESIEGRVQRVQLLTLGNCIPLFTLMPQGYEALRLQLLEVAQDQQVYWVDVSSPSDSVSFGMCNLIPLSVPNASAELVARCVNPRHMCSPRFHTLFMPKTYRWMRRNKMRMHFQYLMATELDGAYDYFSLLTYSGQWMDFIEKRLVR